MMEDMTCLAEGAVFSTDFNKTGINQNEIVVGPTGGGKTFSTAYPRLLHTYNSSVIVPISKSALKEDFARLFKERGYQVVDLNFAEPEHSEYGYDPLRFCHTDEEIYHLASMIIGTANQESGSYDPYWEDAATNVLAAEIHLIMQNARVQGKDPRIADVVRLNRNMKVMPMSDTLKINLTRFFDEAEKRFGDSRAKMLWSTVQNNAPRTTDCVLSFLNTGMNRTFSGNVLKMSKKKQQLDIAKIGQEKTALFITTSPVNNTCSDVVNIMYGDIIRELFTAAEHEPGHRLKVPVHMICDDFACGGKIKDFEKYISIFRATGMSATILLQSESQLVNIYGSTNATTIINNCDTYVYMGGTDLPTCENISRRIDRPIERVLNMDLGRVIVFRRGSKPIIARRYQTLDDEIYKSLGKETEL